MQTKAVDLRELTREFHERGFLVINGALSAQQISALNQSITQDAHESPNAWVTFDESLVETTDILSRTPAFDFTIENPLTLSILRGLIGEMITLEEFEVMVRNPTAKQQDIKAWHRDATRDFDRRMQIEYISLVYYLTDVTQNDHCFSIIPGSHYRDVDLKPSDVVPGTEVDIVGPAGTAVIFHGRCIHAGKLKPNSITRRTLHIYFARGDQHRYSEWTDIPARLYTKEDGNLPPLLYSKWNSRLIFEGVGKKPRDLPSEMSNADMLREVQRRANPVAK